MSKKFYDYLCECVRGEVHGDLGCPVHGMWPFKRKAKPPQEKVMMQKEVPVVDFVVTFKCHSGSYKKDFNGFAFYDRFRSFDGGEDGIVVYDSENLTRQVEEFIKRWKAAGAAVFCDQLVRFDEFLSGTIEKRERTVTIKWRRKT